MKYKVLLTGNHQTMFDDFFVHMTSSFECQSCSCRYEDILSHIHYFEPQIFVYCMSKENPDSISTIHQLKDNFREVRILTCIIGDPDDCVEFAQAGSYAPDLVITRPTTAGKVQDQIFYKAEEKRAIWEAEEKAHKPETVLEKEPETARKKILVVDDDPRMLKLIKTYLIEQYDVATATNGKVALKFLETKKADLILLDYEMPEESGANVLELLRLNPDTMDLPVIFLTGVSDSARIQKVLGLNPQGYLLKPVSRSKLYASIKNVFEKG